MSDIPWTFGPCALGAEPALWSRSPEDPRPDEAEHAALLADARRFALAFAEAHRAGEHAVRRERLTRLGPLVRDAILPFLAAGEWARVLASEPGDDGFALVWTLHRFAPGESLDDLELEPESGYQEVFPVGEDGAFVDHYANRDRECLRLVCWEVPSQSTRWLRLRLAERSVELFF